MRLLFVCTGNICRSVAAHVLTATWPSGGAGVPIEVRSAGTQAPLDRPAHPLTVAALAHRGVDARGHRSRRLSAADVGWADVVFTMTAHQRGAVLALDPRALRKTFTLLEAAALAERLSGFRLDGVRHAERGRAMAAALAEARPGHRAALVDVDDPVTGPAVVHARVVDEIAGALHTLLPALGRQVSGTEQATGPTWTTTALQGPLTG